jgi:hypothetical protein
MAQCAIESRIIMPSDRTQFVKSVFESGQAIPKIQQFTVQNASALSGSKSLVLDSHNKNSATLCTIVSFSLYDVTWEHCATVASTCYPHTEIVTFQVYNVPKVVTNSRLGFYWCDYYGITPNFIVPPASAPLALSFGIALSHRYGFGDDVPLLLAIQKDGASVFRYDGWGSPENYPIIEEPDNE